ncbi:GNAT family N-acetyltransferase [Tropicimonas sediminicola]|uniref:Ribosomal protein S18 acetylase RimI n=1 Tax=Tropicimonas sediminicola TaxID=1031541 RepID=A0A239KHW1_9RHOB|nr:GNAT family N-acetyltransferase [Tropicimonas sediminicola]SNT17966.1 Ribosomal protein S18 acetylase RimI [Tropicimonas sediminicola]
MSSIRDATARDVPALADLWDQAWQSSHAGLVPADLLPHRNRESFRRRLERMVGRIRLAEAPDGAPLGFCVIDSAGQGEIDQLFVTAAAQGTGVAQALLADGEARLAAAGCSRPRLLCTQGNRRAERFYARNGWTSLGPRQVPVTTDDGDMPLTCLIFEKDLEALPAA